jgi:hypothetical protein
MDRAKLTLDDVRSCFSREFGRLENMFVVYHGDVSWAKKSEQEFLANPGVYVWWHPEHGVLRVGISVRNARNRALRHIQADTGGKMKRLGSDPRTTLLLFNIRNQKDDFWLFALEKYFEKSLSPEIKPDRYG